MLCFITKSQVTFLNVELRNKCQSIKLHKEHLTLLCRILQRTLKIHQESLFKSFHHDQNLEHEGPFRTRARFQPTPFDVK